jgi:iron(III) transport system substrate-binding protein
MDLGGNIMPRLRPTRRAVLLGSAAAAGALGWPRASVRAAPPAPESITPQLIEAARSEGKVIWYTSVDLQVAEAIAKSFEAKFAGVAVRIERTGAERVFQRISQERASNIFACDVAQSSDAAHYIAWKREGALTPCVPEDVAKHFPVQHKDVDGLFASWRIWLCGIAYNTKLVKAQEAPKSFADLLDPKWTGKLVKAHPGYSGTVLTATHQMARDLGWSYFEKLAKQKVMQVQSAADPPKKLALGERAVMVDGSDYLVTRLKEKGEPVEFVYATEGTPLITGPSAIMKSPPNPSAARLFHIWSFTVEAQQLNVDVGGLRSAHALVKEPPNRTPLSAIKLMREDAAEVDRMAEEIKAKYTQIFRV